IGKRDLQFKRSIASDYVEILQENREDSRMWVLNQSHNYRKLTQSLLALLEDADDEQKEHILSNICFPMMEQAVDYVKTQEGSLDQLIICPTDQPDPFESDTVFVGELIEQHMKSRLQRTYQIQRLEVVYLQETLAPGSPKAPIYEFVAEEVVRPFKDPTGTTYISQRPGLPDVSLAFLLAGLYQSFRYLTPMKDGFMHEEGLEELEKRIDRYQPSASS
ncbi:MAG: hypothetical protein AAFY70_16785, partial [Bacteroidota bacterium]